MDLSKVKYVGIDIGLKGGVGMLDKEGKLVGVSKMPVNAEGDTDFIGLAKLLRKVPKDAHVITESLNSLHLAGKKQVFSLARQSAIVECAILINHLAWTKVNPKVWQKELWNGQKIITKTINLDKEGTTKMKTDTKKVSENTFRKLFPSHVTSKAIVLRSGRLNDGIVDAVLLATYGKRRSL